MDVNRLADALPELGFFEVDTNGYVRTWSEPAAKLLGFSADEIIGRSIAQLVGEAAGSAVQSGLEVAARQGRHETQGWEVRKDGSRFWANEITTPIRDESGQITGYSRVLRDLSAWKAANDERDRGFTLSTDIMCVTGFDGFFKRVNPSFTRVLGFSEAELLASPFISFVHPEDIATTQRETAAITQTAGRDTTLVFQNRYRHADGTYRWISWISNPMPADQLIYAVGRDITDQKVIDQKLADYARELERSNGELQQFAYVASHDLQEPLRAVAGCLQMLGERNTDNLDERSLELMGHAIDGAKRMQELINDLLAFSRVGSKGISRSWIDPRPAIDKALRHLQVAISESGAAVTVGVMPKTWADPVQFVQLFQNLIGNAIKFRSERRPEIQVSGKEGNGGIIFSVRDNGIGISPEYHERLFTVFQRLHSRREYPGNGIGLAICKKVVERHGGRIWVVSRLGEGTEIKFVIPEGTNKC
jgi:PAS domain S-box-containing protein